MDRLDHRWSGLFFCNKKLCKSKFEQDNDILKNSKPSIRTNLRRLIRIYDYLKGESKKASD